MFNHKIYGILFFNLVYNIKKLGVKVDSQTFKMQNYNFSCFYSFFIVKYIYLKKYGVLYEEIVSCFFAIGNHFGVSI